MSSGVANTIVLYDKDGNPITVKLENGQYRVMTTDDVTHSKLDSIQVLLAAILQALETGK